jgi:hypothetical protein
MEELRTHIYNMNDGKIPHCDFYFIPPPAQMGNGDIKLVTPTEVAVNQAQSQIKKNLSKLVTPIRVIKRPKSKPKHQTGKGRTSGNIKNIRKTFYKRKKKTAQTTSK